MKYFIKIKHHNKNGAGIKLTSKTQLYVGGDDLGDYVIKSNAHRFDSKAEAMSHITEWNQGEYIVKDIKGSCIDSLVKALT